MSLVPHLRTQKTTLKLLLRMKKVGRDQNLWKDFRENSDPGGQSSLWIMQECLGEESLLQSYNKGLQIQKPGELQMLYLESESV